MKMLKHRARHLPAFCRPAVLAVTITLLLARGTFGRDAAGGAHDYWAVEDAQAREKLPLYQVIPAAKPGELTPANGFPKTKTFLNWERSHGDNSGMRYSALRQINVTNVASLQ